MSLLALAALTLLGWFAWQGWQSTTKRARAKVRAKAPKGPVRRTSKGLEINAGKRRIVVTDQTKKGAKRR